MRISVEWRTTPDRGSGLHFDGVIDRYVRLDGHDPQEIHGPGSAPGSLVLTIVPGIESSEGILMVTQTMTMGAAAACIYPEAILDLISSLSNVRRIGPLDFIYWSQDVRYCYGLPYTGYRLPVLRQGFVS